MAFKVCTSCARELPLDAFHKHPRGTGGVGSTCAPCATEKSKVYTRQLRQRVLDTLGRRCPCGWDDERALQIDHRVSGGGRAERLRLGVNGMYRRMLLHPDEYQVLCANCHAIKTSEEVYV